MSSEDGTSEYIETTPDTFDALTSSTFEAQQPDLGLANTPYNRFVSIFYPPSHRKETGDGTAGGGFVGFGW